LNITPAEELASNIMTLAQKARDAIEHATESDWTGIQSSALDDIETLCREFISAQHEQGDNDHGQTEQGHTEGHETEQEQPECRREVTSNKVSSEAVPRGG
jgi:hypothetical protein